jgi:hypothetical protein
MPTSGPVYHFVYHQPASLNRLKYPDDSLDANDQVNIPLFSHSQTGKRPPVRDVHPAKPFVNEKGDGVFSVLV